MTGKRSVTSALALCAGLAACGSSGGSSGGGDEASKSPVQVVADAAAALKGAKSYHLSVHVVPSDGSTPLTLDVDVVAPSSASGTVTQNGVTAHFVYTGGKLFAQGKAFLASLSSQVADLVGDKWAQLPAASASSFSDITNPGKLAACLVQSHGTLSSGGTATVNGQNAVVVVDAGDKPGTEPGKLYVAASGTAYPLKLEATAKAGSSSSSSTSTDTNPTPSSSGSVDCSSSSGSGGVATFTSFNSTASITPPPDAVDLSSLGG
jgi:hypothetical protein